MKKETQNLFKMTNISLLFIAKASEKKNNIYHFKQIMCFFSSYIYINSRRYIDI